MHATLLKAIPFILFQVKKIIWPAQLKRFSVEEVIKRASKRLGENCYDILKNNCEHFVTWSMCGLNVSLQIEQWYLTAREVAYSAFTGLYDFGRNITTKKVLPLLIKLQANVSDEVAAFILSTAWLWCWFTLLDENIFVTSIKDHCKGHSR